MKVEDIKDEHVLNNNAVVQRIAFDCEVCIHENQTPSKSVFRIEYEGQQLEICEAHMQQVLDDEKGGILSEVFAIDMDP